jgi:hypothetical protein
MIKVIISPKQFGKGMNINSFEFLLIFESHGKIGKNKSILSRCKNYVVKTW